MKVRFQCIHDVGFHGSFEYFVESDLPTVSYKNASLEFVEKNTYVRNIPSKMPFTHRCKRILVDVKVHYQKGVVSSVSSLLPERNELNRRFGSSGKYVV